MQLLGVEGEIGLSNMAGKTKTEMVGLFRIRKTSLPNHKEISDLSLNNVCCCCSPSALPPLVKSTVGMCLCKWFWVLCLFVNQGKVAKGQMRPSLRGENKNPMGTGALVPKVPIRIRGP